MTGCSTVVDPDRSLTGADGPAGLYVHTPFCASKCAYCDFYSDFPDRIDEYVAAVVTEAGRRAGRFGRFGTLYLGGGTPSLLPLPALARLVEGLGGVCPLDPGAEVTLEANPDDVTPDRCRAWRHLGFNRLSLGVQALDDRWLRLLGRRHDAASAVEAADAARRAGFDNLGLDLIWGLPGQDEGAWVATLERAAALGPRHLSCYQLTLEPHVPMAARVAAREWVLPDEERSRRLFERTVTTLARLGFVQYEVSNYAVDHGHRSRHNRLYWDHTPYLGLGPSAHAFDGATRSWNVADTGRYIDALAGGGDPTAGSERLSHEQRLLEQLMLGFRTTDGVSLQTLDGCGPDSARVVDDLVAEGLVVLRNGRAVPTLAGLAVADSLPLRFQI